MTDNIHFPCSQTISKCRQLLQTSVPQPRYFHSAVLVPAPPLVDTHGVLYGWGGESGAHLIVFGGRGFTVEESVASEVCLSDAHILDLDTLHWIPSSLSEAPSDVTLPKDIHESKSKSKSTAPSFQDASEHQASSTAASVSSSFSLPAAPHNPYLHHQPPPRYLHIAALSGDHMVVIGGKGLDDTSVTQISVLDLRRHIWMNGGQFHGECDYRISAMAGAVETPMARRRRRYTECLATKGSQVSGQTNSSTGSEPSQRTSSLPIGSELMHPLLNPRKNSWYRGEGRPFELPALDDVQRQRLMSDSELLMDMERDDAVWSQQAKLQGNLNLIQAHGMLGLGMDPEISRAMAQSAGVAMTAENAVARARQSSTGTIKTSSSTHGSHSGSSEKSPKQRSSSRVVAATLTAAPPKMFTKGSNGLLDLEGLATTYARQQPKALSPRAKESTSRKSDGRRKAHSSRETIARTNSRDSTKSNRDSWTSDSTRKSGSLDGEPTISDRRRSLPGEYPVEPEETTKSGDPPPPTNTSQPLFLFSSYRDNENKDRQEFLRIQSSTEACQPDSESVLYDVKPEWVASSMGYKLLAGAEDMTPPKMLFPVGYMIDRQFLLSGSFDKSSRPNSASSATLLNESQDHATNEKQRAFSVWIHHFSNHQWTQLELSKALKLGTWDHSVLDRTDNMLYILGRRGDGLEEDAEMEEPTLRATFTHLVKVDLEGFEVCPGIDEPSVGPAGIKLGLEMLRDGIGADVAIVSAADGGRVWVNSGIVGQRWGHFQKLLESREEARRVEIETIQQLNKAVISEVTTTSDHEPPAPEPKKPYLEDDNVEIIVPETTPILVGFLQYIYTNELSTPHQQRLKTLQGLLLIAHLYDLTRLRQLVRRALYNQLNASNAPAICETAVLTNEFGLQTRALRTLLQSARLAQLRQQAEESEAKRRLEFAVSRMEEMEESRIRIASLQATQAVLRSGYLASASRSGSMPMSGSSQRSAVNSTPTNTSANSTPGLASIGRLFRSREDSEVSTPNAPVGLVISGPAAAAAPIYTPEIMEIPKGIASSLGSTRMRTTSGTGQGATGPGTPGGSTNQQQHLQSKSFHHGSTGDITSVDSVEVHWQKGSTLPSNALPPAPPTSRSSSTTNMSQIAPALTLLSTAGQAHTAPMGAPPASAPSVQIVEGMGGGHPSPGPLTFSEKLHRKLSMKPHPSAALDYFRPSHYHHNSSTSMSQTHDSSSPGMGQDVASPGYGSEGGSTSHHNNQHQQHQPPTYNPRHSLSSSSIDSEVNNGAMGRTGGGEIGYEYASSGTASGSVASSSTRSLASSLHEGNPGNKKGHARSASVGGKGHRRTDSAGSGGFFSKAATSLHAHGHGHGHGGNTSSSGSSSNGSSFLGGLSLSSGDRGSKKSLKKAEKAEKERQRRLEDQRRKTQKTVHVSNTVNGKESFFIAT
ncbi:hypothetical protein BGZ74_000498 [Mortierella antarctica]|nr:hypothetical protein BGZ74_000498 [Mortierella antarctica]